MPDVLPHVEAVKTLLDALPASCAVRVGGRGDAVVDATHSVVVLYPDAGDVKPTSLAGDFDGIDVFVFVHAIGYGPEQAQWALDQTRALLLGAKPTVAGRSTWRIWQEQTMPLTRDDDVTPPLYVAGAEFGLHSDAS